MSSVCSVFSLMGAGAWRLVAQSFLKYTGEGTDKQCLDEAFSRRIFRVPRN